MEDNFLNDWKQLILPNLNYDKKSNHLALRRFTPADVCRCVNAAWSVIISKLIPIKKCLHLSRASLIATNSLSVAE